MAYSFPATVLIITDVLFVTLASSVVLSTLLPSASFSSIPNNSINAPLVPDPSSLDTTVIALLLSNSEPALSPVPVPAESPELLPQPVRHPAIITALKTVANTFFIFIICFPPFLSRTSRRHIRLFFLIRSLP